MKELCYAVMTSIEALMQVPGTQLQHIELTLRQLLIDLKAANITPPAELDDIIEWAAECHKEDLDSYSESEDNYEFWLSTGGQFHSPEEFVEEYIEYLKEKDDYDRSFC